MFKSPQSKRLIAALAMLSSLIGSCRRAGNKEPADLGDSFDSKRGAPVVRGAVTDLDGRGIAGTTVLVRRIGENVRATSQVTAVTDGSGQYVASLEPGPYWVEFRHPLYVAEQRSLRLNRGPHRVDVRLFPPASIRGRALSTSPDYGIAGATVNAWQEVDGLDVVIGSASTAADGSFTLSGLRPGSVRLTAAAGSMGTSQDVTVHLHHGEREKMVELRMTSGFSASGTILGNAATAAAGAWVRAIDRESKTMRACSLPADEDGHFSIQGLVPGTYDIEAGIQDLAQSIARAPLVIDGSNVDGIVLPLAPGGSVSGKIELATRGIVELQPLFDASGTDTPATVRTRRTTLSTDDGRFAFRHVLPGPFALRAQTDSGLRGSRTISVAEGSEQTVAIRLETKRVLLGRVKDALGRSMANLSVQSEAASHTEAKERRDSTEVGGYDGTVVTDDEGRFELEDVPTGGYIIALRDDYGQRAVKRSGERSYAKFVAVSGRADAPLELETPACEGSLRGGVVDSQGREVAYAKLTVERGEQSEPSFDVAKRRGGSQLLANDRGQFEVREICEGSYTIRASSEDEALASTRNAGHLNEQVTIVVLKRATLAGTITVHGIPVRKFSMLAAGPTRIDQSIDAIDGAYRLSDFSPGVYELLISADEGYALEALSVGNEAEIHRDFELRPWSAIRGLAVDRTGVPLAGIEIDLAITPDAAEVDSLGPAVRLRRTTSTRLGRFAFERLPAGKGYITFVQAGHGLHASETRFSTPFGTLLGPSPWLSYETEPGDGLDFGDIRVSTLAGHP